MNFCIDIDKYFEHKGEIIEFIIRNHEKYGLTSTSKLMAAFSFDSVLMPGMGLSHLELELLSKFGALRKEADVYKNFHELLRERNFLQGNVVEVGAGKYPRLCEVIMEDKPDELISVTAYDPCLVFDTIPRVKFVNKPFTKETDISEADTLYGLFPCDASITLIDKAIEENKNLMVAFCACDHSDSIHTKWIGKYWAEDVCMDYREKYGKCIEIDGWNREMGLDLPIMTYKKK